MIKAWLEVERLIEVNAKHRRGFYLQEVRPPFILKQATGELQELCVSPNDINELADLLGVLFHYAIKQGWTNDAIESAMLKKFKERFEAT